jgi:hypothetical protein
MRQSRRAEIPATPETPSTVAIIRERAILNASLFLTNSFGALRLSETEFPAEAKGRFHAGWSILIQPSTEQRTVHLYIDTYFPFSRPSFFLIDGPEFFTWPHVEKSGRLCLLDNVKIKRPELVHDFLRSEMADAFRLVQESEAGTNQADFQQEFHSYWNLQPNLSDKRIYSLLKARGPSRMVRFWHGQHWCVAGESEDDVSIWLKHRHGSKPDYKRSDLACLVWLPVPLVPAEYPRSGADLYSLAKRTSESVRLLQTLALADDAPFPVLLGADTDNGPCFAAVRSHHPRRTGSRGASTPKTRPGFRPGRVPPDLQTRYLFSTDARVEPMEVDRVDAAWVHGRGHDHRQKTLCNKRVIVAGCGSVGAPIAHQLAMAGVGHLTLVDPQALSWSNIGRYPLGSKFIDRPKASALAEFLQENLPHLRIDSFVGTLAEFLGSGADCTADLIVTATADWNSERVLNLDHIDGKVACPLLFAWTEPHACAGHGVYLPAVQPCLQCGFTLGGDMQHPVTKWPEEMPSHLSEPACGAYFQPYGPVELMGTVLVAASLVLDALLNKLETATHRIWAGQLSLLEENGGAWDDIWLARHSDRDEGAFQETIIWQEDPDCTACGHLQRASSISTSASPDSSS